MGDYLIHYGVKGMKWGVRHDEPSGNSKSKSVSPEERDKNFREANKWTFKTLDKDIENIKKNGSKGGGSKKDAIEFQKGTLQRQYDNMSYKHGSKAVLDIAKKYKLEGNLFDKRDPSQFTMTERRVSKDAKKDAEEFARAKAFYGEGAGNRRKAIKTTVEAKTKKDDFYGLEFEYHLSQQDMQKHMTEATAERHRKDGQKKAEKAGRKIERGMQFASRFL